MSQPLSYRPFIALNAKAAQREPDRTLVDVGQKQPSSAKVHELFQPTESEPEPVAAKKKRSPEAIAKQKATLASKKRKATRASNKVGEKAAFIRAHPNIPVPELVELARKQGLAITQTHAYQVRKSGQGRAPTKSPKPRQVGNGPSSNEASLTDLLQAITEATSEIARRLSQLTL